MIDYTQQDYERDVAIVKSATQNAVMIDDEGRYFDGSCNALGDDGFWSFYDYKPIQPLRLLSDIEKLINMYEREQERQWISVEDRLPNYGEPVLLMINGVVQHVTYMYDAGDDYDWLEPFHYEDKKSSIPVFSDKRIEWMPLPLPPEELRSDSEPPQEGE